MAGFNDINGSYSYNSGNGVMPLNIVNTTSEVPIPGAIWLLGACVVGLVGLRLNTKM